MTVKKLLKESIKVGERDLTAAQCDAFIDRTRTSYRPGRTSPFNYFCNLIGKNGL